MELELTHPASASPLPGTVARACPPASGASRAEPAAVDVSDAEIMAQVAAGDLQGLGELYRRHGAGIAAVLSRMLPAELRPEVDDLVQDVFLEARALARRYVEQGSLRAWLVGVATRKARNLRRKHWIRTKLLRQERPQVTWGASARAGVAGAEDRRMDLQRALDQLPAAQREVLVLHTVMGFTAEEIGLALGLRPGSVWARLHRSRHRLLDLLGPAVDSPPGEASR